MFDTYITTIICLIGEATWRKICWWLVHCWSTKDNLIGDLRIRWQLGMKILWDRMNFLRQSQTQVNYPSRMEWERGKVKGGVWGRLCCAWITPHLGQRRRRIRHAQTHRVMSLLRVLLHHLSDQSLAYYFSNLNNYAHVSHLVNRFISSFVDNTNALVLWNLIRGLVSPFDG